MITTQQQESEVKELTCGDAEFQIHEGIMVYFRAGIRISEKMPHSYKEVVVQCLQRGWLTSVASVRDSELAAGKMWNNLKNTGE
jgi:hypothetical protein